MKTINEQREEIMLAVKRAVGENSVTYEPDSDYCMFGCDDIDHIAEEAADNLIENGYREICAGACDELDTVEYGVVGTLKGMIEQLKNEIDALKDELRRVSEDSKERDNENLKLQAALDDAIDKYKAVLESYERVCNDCVQQWKNGYNDGYDSGFEGGEGQTEKDSYERGFADEKTLVKEFARKLKDRLNADYVNGGLNNNKNDDVTTADWCPLKPYKEAE